MSAPAPLPTALRIADISKFGNGAPCACVREKQYGRCHDVLDGAPDEWAATRGATHTLYVGAQPGTGPTRPAKLFKTVLYVGVDENEFGDIVWEKWQVSVVYRFAGRDA